MIINKVSKLSAVLDWKIYHSVFITLLCSKSITEITKIGKPVVNFWSNAVVL